MTPTSRLYDALNDFLRQCDIQWQEVHYLQNPRWTMIDIIQTQDNCIF